MDIDFSVLLFVLTLISGALYALDRFVLRGRRVAAAERFAAAGHRGLSADEVELRRYRLLREPLVIEYAKSFFPVLGVVFLLRSFVIEPYQIPTGSMIPTLEVGDFVLVNKYAYGLRLPIVGGKLVAVGEPRRGDIMVFVPPHEDKYYIKRVIGLPGDVVRYEDKRLYINGTAVPREYGGTVAIAAGFRQREVTRYRETIDGIEHTAHYIAARSPRPGQRSSWVVPAGRYFMMGDNRDDSLDSRAWGPAAEGKIVGKAVAVWMHKEPGWHLPTFARNRWLGRGGEEEAAVGAAPDLTGE